MFNIFYYSSYEYTAPFYAVHITRLITGTRSTLGTKLLQTDVCEICGLLGYYAASCGNCLPTFRDNVSVPSSRVKSPSRKVITQKTTDFINIAAKA
jgi:hypothetical protein